MISRRGKSIADEAEAALGMEALAVVGDDAGGFLAAMLERVQPERGDGGCVGMTVDAEDAAFFAQPVAVDFLVQEAVVRLHRRSRWPDCCYLPDLPSINWRMLVRSVRS